MYNLIEYASILFKINSDNVLISTGCDEIYTVEFPVILSLDMASKTCWTVVGYFLQMKRIQTWAIVCWLGDIWHVVMFTVLCYNANGSAYWWEIDIDFKYSFLMKGWYERSIFNVVRVEVFVTRII